MIGKWKNKFTDSILKIALIISFLVRQHGRKLVGESPITTRYF